MRSAPRPFVALLLASCAAAVEGVGVQLLTAMMSPIKAMAGFPEKHYGIVFDAGSSGTRIHVYTWKTGGGGAKDSFDLVSDELLKIKPGLSSYKERPSDAGASLAPLIEFAKGKIPADRLASTPMFLMATAGLRMVGEAAKDAILASVCAYLSGTGFLFRCEWATLLDGRDEGLYGWVTVNYLLDALYPGGSEPAGIIDLGGGSVQIVFPSSESAPAGYSEALDFAGRNHKLYVKSHLGFGLDAARTKVLDLVVRNASPVTHPCLPLGASATHNGVMIAGGGDYKHCKKLVKKLFDDDDTPCKHGKGKCSFGGAFQPALPKTFYGFSYLFDRTAAIGLLNGKPTTYGTATMTRDDIEHAAKAICGLNKDAVAAKFSAANDAAKSANFCGDVIYLEALLDAFGFDDHTPMTMTNKIKDVELVWTLGAMLAKSAELANGGGGGGGGGWVRSLLIFLVAAAGCWYYFVGRHPSKPLKLYRDERA